jgi:DNA-binding NarL/FixJ family response regulator
MNVLVIGYVAYVLECTASELRDSGYEVVSKLGCGPALQELSQSTIRVVVLDRSVPELSKLLLCRRILQLYPAIRVVVVTAGDANPALFPAECVLVPASVTPKILVAAVEGAASPIGNDLASASESGAAVGGRSVSLQAAQSAPTVTPPTAPPQMPAEPLTPFGDSPINSLPRLSKDLQTS